MDWELAHLRRLLDASSEDWHAGQLAYRAQLGGHPIVLAACGIGMVSAAARTQHVISRYTPRAVVNYGCAGAHRTDLLPGDIVVGTRLVAYDNIRETPEGERHYRAMYFLEAGAQRRVDALHVDAQLLGAARRAADVFEAHHEAWPLDLDWPAEVPHRPGRVVFGTVCSADRWNRSPATIAGLVSRHDSLCEDMEAAAIGLVCASEGVPCISIKDISNNELLRPTAGGQAMLRELGVDQVARRAAAFALAVMEEWIRA